MPRERHRSRGASWGRQRVGRNGSRRKLAVRVLFFGYAGSSQSSCLWLTAKKSGLDPERLDQVMAMLPKQLDVDTNLSIQPLKLPLYLNSPLAFKSVYLLTRYDELVCRILLAAHIGLIDNGSKEAWLDEGAAVLRRLYGVGQRYKGYSGASRDDIAANNVRATNAQLMYSFLEMPKDVLEGARRSKFAPAIQRPGDAPATSCGGDDGFDGDSADEDEHLGAMASAYPIAEISEA